jgi:YVTN family beta-propeller protein
MTVIWAPGRAAIIEAASPATAPERSSVSSATVAAGAGLSRGLWLPLLLVLCLLSCAPRPATPSGSRLYVTNEMSGDLSIIDVDGRRTIGRIALGKRPRGIVASPDGRLLYIALSGSPVGGPGVDESTLPPADKAADGIAVFDIAAGRVLRVIRGVSDPETVAVSRDGRRLYVASEDTGRLIVLDAEGGGIRAAIPVGGEPEGVAVSPDGALIYATSEADHSVAVIEAGSLRVRARVPVGERPRNAVFTAGSDRAFVPGESDGTITSIDVPADRPAGTARLAGENIRPMGVALSRDGRSLFVTTGRGRQLLRLDPATLRETGRVEVGDRPWGLALSPDGRFVFTANGPSNDVAMVDANTLRIAARFAGGQRPWGVAFLPSH